MESVEDDLDGGGGILSTLGRTPGWVWVVIGGVVLLLVGVMAASARGRGEGA